jgi:hypothetical protein
MPPRRTLIGHAIMITIIVGTSVLLVYQVGFFRNRDEEYEMKEKRQSIDLPSNPIPIMPLRKVSLPQYILLTKPSIIESHRGSYRNTTQ